MYICMLPSIHIFASYSSTHQLQKLKKPLHSIIDGPRREKIGLWGFVNNTGADQPAIPRCLISAFVIDPYWRLSYQNFLQAKFHYSS